MDWNRISSTGQFLWYRRAVWHVCVTLKRIPSIHFIEIKIRDGVRYHEFWSRISQELYPGDTVDRLGFGRQEAVARFYFGQLRGVREVIITGLAPLAEEGPTLQQRMMSLTEPRNPLLDMYEKFEASCGDDEEAYRRNFYAIAEAQDALESGDETLFEATLGSVLQRETEWAERFWSS